MNWVAERAEREKLIAKRGPDLWSDVCSAFEEAVKSMERIYTEHPIKSEYTRVSENKFVVRARSIGSQTREISGTFHPDRKEIVIGVGMAKRKHVVNLEVVDGVPVLMLDNRQVTPDELSREVLGPVFFRDT